MALQLLAVQQRSSTRIRLKFDGSVASGAFGAAALAGYTAAESYDGTGVAARTWAVTGAIAIASDLTAIELVLSTPASDGAWFWIQFNAPVPAVADTPFVGATSPKLRTFESAPAPSPEVPTSELDAILFGEDLVFRDGDWLETAEGDLLATTGMENAVQAEERRMLSEGLQWDPRYGLRPRRFIDGPTILAPSICGEAQAQAVLDDRVVGATSRIGEADKAHPEEVFIRTVLTFFNGQTGSVSTPIARRNA